MHEKVKLKYEEIYFFIFFVLQNESRLKEALLFANACGAITVTGMGAIPALPTKDAVHQILGKSTT